MQRPFGVWFLIVWTVTGVILMIAQNFFGDSRPGTFDQLATALLLIAELVAIYYLYKLKKKAVNVFLLVLILRSIYAIYSAIVNPVQSSKYLEAAGVIIGIFINILVYLYVRHLDKKGLLT